MINGRVTKSRFEELLSKLETHLAGWKTAMLSSAGRVTLAKTVLSALSNHLMLSEYLSKAVCDAVDKGRVAWEFVL